MIDATPKAIDHLARRLIALEAARDAGSAATRVCDELRIHLIKLAGIAGFRSLLTRALALAKAATPGMDGVRVEPDGTLIGFDVIAPDRLAECGESIVDQFFRLLATLIGEPLTLRLVGDAWPDAIDVSPDFGSGKAS